MMGGAVGVRVLNGDELRPCVCFVVYQLPEFFRGKVTNVLALKAMSNRRRFLRIDHVSWRKLSCSIRFVLGNGIIQQFFSASLHAIKLCDIVLRIVQFCHGDNGLIHLRLPIAKVGRRHCSTTECNCVIPWFRSSSAECILPEPSDLYDHGSAKSE